MKKDFLIGILTGILIVLFLLGAIFYFAIRQPRKKKEIAFEEKKARVAIVLDDWGYNMNNIRLLESINIPLTISMLPNLNFSERIAEKMHSYNNREIILHMPMQPQGETVRLEKNTLLISMNDEQLIALLKNAFESVPYAKGISTHMGSKATQDRRLIKTILKELKKRRLYFLDSLSTPKSVCRKEAKNLGVKFIERDIFLDNISDKSYISSQIDSLIEAARQNGSAVGVGHDRRLTLAVIKEKANSIKQNNIEFVLISELLSGYERR